MHNYARPRMYVQYVDAHRERERWSVVLETFEITLLEVLKLHNMTAHTHTHTHTLENMPNKHYTNHYFEIGRLFIYYALCTMCSPGREEKRKIDIR